ncbi:DUF1415 domain-containing protein [Methylomonas sp. AM2-LC]|uniref:DUF1415 domain-containing protein n=1 Tax=Methylomonas sp. AM2-LC TaxID=3153301 RepID=UPI00326619EC
MTSQEIINTTQNWLTSFIITYSICPFARQVHENNSISYEVISDDSLESGLLALIKACQHLDTNPEIVTTLQIFTAIGSNFDDFLDFVAIAEQLLIDQGYEGIYQLANFHPDYCFAGSTENDPANYTNRSPYPMLHIIREDSITAALQSYQNPELIPERNIEFTRKLGLEKLQGLLAGSYLDTSLNKHLK